MTRTHVPLNFVQKSAVTLLSGIGALLRPARADLVAAFGETSGELVLPRLVERIKASEEGRQLLCDRPRVTNDSIANCWSLPHGTFGAAYAQFMDDRKFKADERTPVRFVEDAEQAYVISRIREVHDFWHVLFACDTNLFGEIALKALEFVQTGLPMTGLAVLGGQAKLSMQDRLLLYQVHLPWALKAGQSCKDLFSIYYEKKFEMDLEELRRELNIIVAPPPKGI